MEIYTFGNPKSGIILIQPTGVHEIASLQNEYDIIRDMTNSGFCLKGFKVNNWNDDLSPWESPAIFGNDGFGGGANLTFDEIISCCNDESKTYFIGGYSLAGLFSLWTAFNSRVFKGVAACSPSVWFPGFDKYMNSNKINADIVYLSLGDKEEKTRNKTMCRVGDNIRVLYKILTDEGKITTLEWNEGNHFKDAPLRTAKGFAYLLSNYKK